MCDGDGLKRIESAQQLRAMFDRIVEKANAHFRKVGRGDKYSRSNIFRYVIAMINTSCNQTETSLIQVTVLNNSSKLAQKLLRHNLRDGMMTRIYVCKSGWVARGTTGRTPECCSHCNTVNVILSMQSYQCDTVNVIRSMQCCWCNTVNVILSMQYWQCNIANTTLSMPEIVGALNDS